ncbi:MAG: shikimate dehydrogenase [Planctomycetes bacterium]|nr:shikimate dehydrogenase [Planctomycetota bacterium]
MTEPYSCEKTYVGCFGDPVWENPTEVMMQAALDHHGLPVRYITTLVPANRLADAVRGVKALGFKGFNCTLPHKVAVIEHLDGLGPSAEIMDAVNCVVERDGRYIGENTDGKGFLESLRPVVDPAGKRILIFGAGGAARAVSVETALAGAASITVVNRTPERGEGLVNLLNTRTDVPATFVPWIGDHAVGKDIDVVVNTTSIGLFPDTSRVAVDVKTLHPGLVCADLIPNPPRTRFLQEAEAAGAATLDGLGMLVNQGRIGITYWTGVEPDASVMRAALERIFG